MLHNCLTLCTAALLTTRFLAYHQVWMPSLFPHVLNAFVLVKCAAYLPYTLQCCSVQLQDSVLTTRCGCHRPSLMCSMPLYWLNVLHTCLTLCTLQCCSVKLQGSLITSRCGCHRPSLMCSMPLYWLNVLHTCLTICSAALFSCKIPCLPPGVDAIALPSCAQCLCTG